MAGRLGGKVCIITGTGGAIGRASALKFAAEGANVVGCGIRGDPAQETVDMVLAAGGTMVSNHPGSDLVDPANAKAIVDLAVREFGQVDVLFNNAGNTEFNWIENITIDEWNATIAAELTSVFNMTQAAWSELAKRGGAIVNTASVNGRIGYEVLGALVHTAAKGGILAMTKQLAMEGRHHGIRCNSVSPGLVATDTTGPLIENNPAFARSMLAKIMRGTPGRPEEIANAAAFLASDEASFVNGTDLLVDGGTTAW